MAGKLTVNQVQLGDSPTATQNFVLQTNVDGTAKLARGNAGATTQDILSIDINGRITLHQGLGPTSATQSMVRVNTGSGYGVVSTCIRRFTNVTNGVNGCIIQGTDITRVDTANEGTTFVVNTAGVYAISYSDSTSNASGMGLGISLNSTQLSTDINTISAADRLISANTPATANYRGSVSTTVYIPAGGVVRAHADGSGGGGGTATFTISRVG